MSSQWERFGAALREYRVSRRGATQRQLAEDAGISATRFSDIERGRRPPLSFTEIEGACGGVGDDVQLLLDAIGEPDARCPRCGAESASVAVIPRPIQQGVEVRGVVTQTHDSHGPTVVIEQRDHLYLACDAWPGAYVGQLVSIRLVPEGG